MSKIIGNCIFASSPSRCLPVGHQGQEKAYNSVHHPPMKTPELRQKMRILKNVASIPLVEGDVDCLLGKSVVRKAWVSGETIWSYLTSIEKKGHNLGGNMIPI